MSSVARAYSAAFVEESLGLPHDSLTDDSVPSDLVDQIRNSVSGSCDQSPEPLVEVSIMKFLAGIEEDALARQGFTVRKCRWPGNASFAACLTHDVDNLARPRGHVIARRSRFSAGDFLLGVLGLRSLYDNVQFVAGMERQRKVSSSFYFLSSNYPLAPLADRLKRLKSEGWDIGLHGDFGTHDSTDEMRRAIERFRSATGISPEGLREHYLRFDYARSWDVFEEAGFTYDTTVGNTDRLGFRIGLCTPFHPPRQDWTAMRLVELPLTLMDTTLWGYLRRTESEGMRDYESLKSKVKETNGLMTILWHQESLRMKGGRIYPKLLDDLKGGDCYVGSGAQVAAWWNARAVPLVRDGDTLTVDGAPAGLCLSFKAKEERKLAVQGGTVESRGPEKLIRATSGDLRVKVG